MMTVEEEYLAKFSSELKQGKIKTAPSWEYFDKISKNFPIEGTQVAWTKVPGAVGKKLTSEELADYIENAAIFADTVLTDHGILNEDKVVIINDSAIECALELSPELYLTRIRDFLDLPQHNFLVSVNASWLIAFTMEGFLWFGKSPALYHDVK